jgi:1-acyl-sn-glycerol-3-phosphate acyltransferase
LLYAFLKIYVRLAMVLICRKIVVNKPSMLRSEGPLLIACNHPNSFLDSIILDTLFEKPVWSLARGDVFKSPRVVTILNALKILPVYRPSEGVENLSENYKTFKSCVAIFRKKGIVQIFSEGKCINEWHLRPLKKGTARLAIQSWEDNIPLRVLPTGINYSSFRTFGKNIYLNFGNLITREHVHPGEADGLKHQSFNAALQQELEKLVFEIPKDDRNMQASFLQVKIPLIEKLLLGLPAIIGWLLHAPLYFPVKWLMMKKAGDSDHYDSLINTLLLITYPFYILIITIIAGILANSWWVLLLILVFPFTAWASMRLKKQLD